MKNSLGILAGSGELPIILANNALEMGYNIYIYSFIEENHDNSHFPKHLHRYIQKVHLLKYGTTFKLFKKDKINELVLVGKINKKSIFNNLKFDLFTLKTLLSLKNKNDMEAFKMLQDLLTDIHVTILPQTKFLKSLLLTENIYTKKKPTQKEWDDIKYGMIHAKKISNLDIGQTVIVKDGILLAVEAVESTNDCIIRGGLLAKKDAIVCKTARSKQSNKFDIPAVGLQTLEAMITSKCKILVIEANTMYAINLDEMIKLANKKGIIFLAVHMKNMY